MKRLLSFVGGMSALTLSFAVTGWTEEEVQMDGTPFVARGTVEAATPATVAVAQTTLSETVRIETVTVGEVVLATDEWQQTVTNEGRLAVTIATPLEEVATVTVQGITTADLSKTGATSADTLEDTLTFTPAGATE